jgi:3-oxoadipate enol-lactonase
MVSTRGVHVGDVQLRIAEAGEGGRPFLLVHGFTGAKEDFTDALDLLAARGWHAVAPDLRGHGDSDKPEGEDRYSLEIFAADLLGLVDALRWERLLLLGHSMGGMVAQHIAVTHRERLTGLVLMDTTHGPVDWVDQESFAMGRALVVEHGMAALLEAQKTRRDTDPLVSPASLRLLRERPGYEEFGDRKFLAASEHMWLAMSAELRAQSDRLASLERVRVPTLVLVGEQDTPFIPHSERMAKTIPGARLAVIPDAGHSPQFENTDGWWAALGPFLEEVS